MTKGRSFSHTFGYGTRLSDDGKLLVESGRASAT